MSAASFGRFKGRIECSIRAVHIHHGLRGAEADRDARYVEELSGMWEVPCAVVHVQAAEYAREHGLSLEEAAGSCDIRC